MFNTINTKAIKNNVSNLIHSAFVKAAHIAITKSRFTGSSLDGDCQVDYYVSGAYFRLVCGAEFYAMEFGPQHMEFRITSVDDENGKRFLFNKFFVYSLKDIPRIVKNAFQMEINFHIEQDVEPLGINESKRLVLAFIRSNGMTTMDRLYSIAGMLDLTLYDALHQLVAEGLIRGIDPKSREAGYTYHTEVAYFATIIPSETYDYSDVE